VHIASSIDPSGENVAYVAGDIGDPEISARLVKTASERFGGVDVLFNNAGVFEPKPFLHVTQDDLQAYFRLMAFYFTVTQYAVGEMKKRGGGAVISIGSIWALQGIAATPSSAPSMAKGGIHSLTRALAIELAPHKIRVNAIAPAVVETPLFDPLLTSATCLVEQLPSPGAKRATTRHLLGAALSSRRRAFRLDHRRHSPRGRRRDRWTQRLVRVQCSPFLSSKPTN
jgi:NAD(P)-dependent dehydrogenase (short-subunit alcohol dehydrogenase family)